MLNDREWMLTEPWQREIIWQLRSIKAASWAIAWMIGGTLIAIGLAIALHL